ncbi:MAG: hypothetical protein MI924_35660, partial [Chloroflexales bacterium]|nr:hypothetical protein [Chloroflexales bacterium]
ACEGVWMDELLAPLADAREHTLVCALGCAHAVPILLVASTLLDGLIAATHPEATGVVVVSADPAPTLAAALRAVLRGRTYRSPAFYAPFADVGLTPREQTLLVLEVHSHRKNMPNAWASKSKRCCATGNAGATSWASRGPMSWRSGHAPISRAGRGRRLTPPAPYHLFIRKLSPKGHRHMPTLACIVGLFPLLQHERKEGMTVRADGLEVESCSMAL